ncbi:MAG TPA: tetratricopeptide repeat protein [Bryobacteraceae bacterium]|nr:tetratricopeptide repeat protein [Bryobacteraceae bacterium]
MCRRTPVCVLLLAGCCAGAPQTWLELRTPHLELITTAGEREAHGLAAHLERFRGLFEAQGILGAEPGRPPVRVLAFRSEAEYAPFRLNPSADAYYVGAPGRDYIVLTLRGPEDFGTAAHEYAHLMTHHARVTLPAWLAEGLAEVASTVRFRGGEAMAGGPKLARRQALERNPWIPLAELTGLEAPPAESRERGAMFYAESWAVAHLLLFSPAYRPRLAEFLARLTSGAGAGPAFAEVYGASLAEVERGARAWAAQRSLPSVTLAAGAAEAVGMPRPLEEQAAELALAELELVTGKLERAEADYRRLAARLPESAEIQAALGRIALAGGRRPEARERFRKALELGVRNAPLCYEYALLAQDNGVPESEVVTALERALEADPGLDDARYSLALAHMNAGRYRAALAQLQALRLVPARRAFAYYSALAYTQTELGMREEAARSAGEARKYAQSEDDAEHANQLAWVAQSDLVVQMGSGKTGAMRRIPHRQPGEEDGWNPFIDPADRVRRAEGDLRDVACSAGALRLTVGLAEGQLVLSIPDPGRVQIRTGGEGTFEFTCGPQDGPRVRVEYAAAPDAAAGVDGVLRGMQVLR